MSSSGDSSVLTDISGVKVAKEILSSDRDNLALWDGFARLERQRGKIAAARQVYVTAIQSVTARIQESNDGDLQLDEAELWASWAEMEWEEGNDDRCMEVLVMAAGSQRQALGENIHHLPLANGTAPCIAPEYQPQAPSPVSVLKSRQVSCRASISGLTASITRLPRPSPQADFSLERSSLTTPMVSRPLKTVSQDCSTSSRTATLRARRCFSF